MKIGYLALNDSFGIRPDVLGRALEERGFDSLWVAEHTNIPVGSGTPYPSDAPLPEGYRQTMDPFLSLAVAAAATSELRLCTGVCLILQRDLIDLAVTTATLDVLSGGRLGLGVGVGWNTLELANHRPDVAWNRRYGAMRERVEALRTIWANEIVEFGGTYDQISPTYIAPKPLTGSIPIIMGSAGPVGVAHAAEYAEEWCPMDAAMRNAEGRLDIPGSIASFRDLLVSNGRDPNSVPITIFAMGNLSKRRIASYAECGIQRVVLPPPTMDLHSSDRILAHLDEIVEITSGI